ncbi:FxsA family protein [Candidatus Auribacterota bacterium]
MLGYLIVLFTVVPIIELAILIRVGQFLGLLPTLAIVIVTGVVGAYLARLQGMLTLQRIQQDMAEGKMPTDKLVDGMIILCSGILLLTPGLITDAVGFAGLIPVTRHMFKQFIKNKIKDMISKGNVKTFTMLKK